MTFGSLDPLDGYPDFNLLNPPLVLTEGLAAEIAPIPVDTSPVIVNATVVPVERYYLAIMVELADDTYEDVWRWFSDERRPNVTTDEIIGLTADAARTLFSVDDVAYIRSWV